jgi:hypothetical protein
LLNHFNQLPLGIQKLQTQESWNFLTKVLFRLIASRDAPEIRLPSKLLLPYDEAPEKHHPITITGKVPG